MPARKKATKKNERPTEHEILVRQRIAQCMRDFCRDEKVVPSSAYKALSVGWKLRKEVLKPAYKGSPAKWVEVVREPARAWAQDLCGNESAEKMGRPFQADHIPKGDMLWALCDRLDINAEWLFTGRGAPTRQKAASGADLPTDELARQLAAHLVPHVRQGQRVTIHAINGREALKAAERAAVGERDMLENLTLQIQASGLALGALRRAIDFVPIADREDFRERIFLAEVQHRRLADQARELRKSRHSRIVVDSATLTDTKNPVYRASDRIDSKRGKAHPAWIVKVGDPP